MVFRELRAAIVVMPGIDAVHTLAARLALQLFHQSFGHAIDAANGGHHPYLVAHAHVAVLAHISLKGSIFLLDAKFFVYRLICIFKRATEVGFQVLLVYPFSGLQVLTCVANGIAVFNNVLALAHVAQEHLVTCGCVLQECHLLSVDVYHVALLPWLQADDDRVSRIDFQKCCLFHDYVFSLV